MQGSIRTDLIIRFLHQAGYDPAGQVTIVDQLPCHEVRAVDPADGHLYIVRAPTIATCWCYLADRLGINLPD